MKQQLTTYSISGSSITLTGVNVPLDQILLISDATTGAVLYSLAGPAPTSYTQATNSNIVVSVAPGSNSDKLTIIYEDGLGQGVSINAGTNNIGQVTLPQSNTPTVSSFTSTSSATVVSASASTKGVLFCNGSTATAYILLGSGTASSSNFSFYLVQGDLVTVTGYQGQINGILSAAGSVAVTVLT